MLGFDMVLFTKEGFKPLSELNLYDEVLTPLGIFEPIIKMSRVEDVDYYIKTSTDEIIACSRDLELPVYDKEHNEKMVCVSCIKNKQYYTTKILPYDSSFTTRDNLYRLGTDIPSEITNDILKLSEYHRYELLCGLMDTPICELKSKDGIYVFKPHSPQFEKGLVALLRLFGFPVTCSVSQGHRIIRFGIQNIAVIDDIPIRDDYKDINDIPPDNRYCFMPIRDNGTLKNKVKGRAITVEGGLVLAGYSLVPVKCQKL